MMKGFFTAALAALAVSAVSAAVLALAGVGALAASLLWRDQAASMKQIEQSGGDYAGWSIEDKAALVRALVDSGHLMQGGETERLFDEGTPEAERHAIADALLLALTGQTAVEEISVDIITYAILKTTHLSESQVVGSGTMLDSARLRSRLAAHVGLNSKNVHAYVFGEHGETSFIPWSIAQVSTINLLEYKDLIKLRTGILTDLSLIHI